MLNVMQRGYAKAVALVTLMVATVCAAMATTGPTEYDLSTDIAEIKTAAWASWISPNAAALLGLLGFFVGLAIVLKLSRRFGAKTNI